MKIKSAKGVVIMKDANGVEPYLKDINLCIKDDVEERNLVEDTAETMNLVKGIAEIKMKMSELESKLGKVSVRIPFLFTLCLFIGLKKKTEKEERTSRIQLFDS